jgi:hypothetical protein
MPIVFKTEEERNPTNKTTEVVQVEENLTQIAYSEGEEGQLAIEFLEENGLYSKFLLWQGIKEQLKKMREELAN